MAKYSETTKLTNKNLLTLQWFHSS